MKTHCDVLIVGAGMCGLVAARELQRAGADVIVVDKGRGVGGRMATRRVGAATYDHGAQFITVRSDRFRELMDELLEAKAAALWFSGDGRVAGGTGHPRYRGSPGMTAIPKYLASTGDIRLNVRVEEIRPASGRWHVTADAGRSYQAAALLLTAPVPQSMTMLAAGGTMFDPSLEQTLTGMLYDPCLALLVRATGAVSASHAGLITAVGGKVAWAADNQVKGVSAAGPAITVHCTPSFSAQWYDRDDGDVISAVTRELADLPAFAEAEVSAEDAVVKRWRYARPANPLDVQALSVPADAPLVIAGDAMAGARVEGAALSGYAAADALR